MHFSCMADGAARTLSGPGCQGQASAAQQCRFFATALARAAPAIAAGIAALTAGRFARPVAVGLTLLRRTIAIGFALRLYAIAFHLA
jgi:hypothetical protein